jgi:hypothetical protein
MDEVVSDRKKISKMKEKIEIQYTRGRYDQFQQSTCETG